MEERERKKQIVKISVLTTSLFVICLSVTYSFINLTLMGTKKQVITAGNLNLKLQEDNNITIADALPVYDEVGMIQDAFTFRLVNNSSSNTNYVLKLVDVTTGTKLSTSDVKYCLTKDGIGTPKLLSTSINGIIDSGIIKGNQTIDYALRFWISSGVTKNSEIAGKSLSYRINVEVSQWVEMVADFGTDNSNANSPELASGMIPVVYNEMSKSWEKADTTQSKYYNYEKQVWANAVTVTKSTRDFYMSASVGTPVSMNDINTMWVWIPRYEYQYTDLGNLYAGGTKELPGEIKVNFVSKSTTTPSVSGVYKIPEGFTFGGEPLSGFWMAKFETSNLEGCMPGISAGTGCDLTTLTPQIKPNVTSWRGARVSTYFTTSRKMQTEKADIYGFSTNGTMDVHMLKNTEWGIVAMLSQSKYGKYGNSAYTGANKEVYQNKSSDYITGSSNGMPSSSTRNSQVTYDTPDTGYGASTTGTAYGVYDMSGGADEYVMGNYNQISGMDNDYNSGFCGTNGPTSGCAKWPDAKYYDNYTTTSVFTAYKSGDATHEVNGWYSDYSFFVSSSLPWFLRGGFHNNNINAGVFGMSGSDGDGVANYGTRLAIKP